MPQINRIPFIDDINWNDFEIYMAHALSILGFKHVHRTQATRDFGADILAQKDGVKFSFQCKHRMFNNIRTSRIGQAEYLSTFDGLANYHTTCAVLVTNGIPTAEILEREKRNSRFIIWGRTKLRNIYDKVNLINNYQTGLYSRHVKSYHVPSAHGVSKSSHVHMKSNVNNKINQFHKGLRLAKIDWEKYKAPLAFIGLSTASDNVDFILYKHCFNTLGLLINYSYQVHSPMLKISSDKSQHLCNCDKEQLYAKLKKLYQASFFSVFLNTRIKSKHRNNYLTNQTGIIESLKQTDNMVIIKLPYRTLWFYKHFNLSTFVLDNHKIFRTFPPFKALRMDALLKEDFGLPKSSFNKGRSHKKNQQELYLDHLENAKKDWLNDPDNKSLAFIGLCNVSSSLNKKEFSNILNRLMALSWQNKSSILKIPISEIHNLFHCRINMFAKVMKDINVSLFYLGFLSESSDYHTKELGADDFTTIFYRIIPHSNLYEIHLSYPAIWLYRHFHLNKEIDSHNLFRTFCDFNSIQNLEYAKEALNY